MPEFIYEAMANSGQRSQGTLTAGSEREVMSMLDARGLFPVKITLTRAASVGRTGGRRVKSRHMTAFYAQLADLLHSGVPMLRSLDILERQTSQPALAGILREPRPIATTYSCLERHRSLLGGYWQWFCGGPEAPLDSLGAQHERRPRG